MASWPVAKFIINNETSHRLFPSSFYINLIRVFIRINDMTLQKIFLEMLYFNKQVTEGCLGTKKRPNELANLNINKQKKIKN